MKKIVVRLMGGLGNQLFQYAFGKALSKKYNVKLELDVSSYLKEDRAYALNAYAIREELLSSYQSLYYNTIYILDSKLGIPMKKIVHEKESFQFEEILVDQSRYFVGFWQNEQYFNNIISELCTELVLKEKCDNEVKTFIENIEKQESVAVHVRRGDYLLPRYSKDYVLQGMEYYQRAHAYLANQKSDLKFYIFSDDIKWCRQNFNWSNCKFVDESITNDAIIQFEIMRKCKHFIIGNSTYSWWASWLSENEAKIRIAPSHWYVEPKVDENCRRALLTDYILI